MTRRETLKPIIERMVDQGTINLMKVDLWAASYLPEDNIRASWILETIANREKHNAEVAALKSREEDSPDD